MDHQKWFGDVHSADFLTGRFDMHVHTTASDGIWRPAEIVRRARECGLTGLAITDHDTLDGLPEAAAAAKELGVRLVFGVEMSTDVQGGQDEDSAYEVHMLGYFPGDSLPGAALAERLGELQRHRWQRGLKMMAKLAELGMPLDDSFLQDYAGGGSIGRGLLARKMVEAGYAAEREEVFAKWLGIGCPAYVPHHPFTPFEALQLIHAAGGVAVMAHPVQAGHDELIFKLAAAGLDGLECRHPDQPAGELQQHYLQMADSLHLAISGGSDCHDGGLGDYTISGAELLELFADRSH